MVFDDDGSDDDQSESAYLPNVSPIQVRLEEEDFGGEAEPFADLHVNQATPKKVDDDNDCSSDDDDDDDDDNDDAGIAEAVDTLLKMHPLPSTTKKGARQQQQQQTMEVGTEMAQKEEEDVEAEAEAEVAEEWRNATDPKSGRTYYYNRRTRETRWKLPANAILIPRKEKKKEQGAQKKEASLSVSSGHERSSDSTTRPSTARQTKSACSHSPLNNLNNLTPPRDDGTGLDNDTCPADSATGAAIRPEVAASTTTLQGITTTTPAPPPAAASAVPTHSHSQSHSHHRQRQNADDHSMFCIYCASSCGSIDGMADHLLECEAYMSMLSKHPRAQRRLEDMMLRTWGIKRQVLALTAEDSFDARLISHSHLGGDGMLDAVASPSIAEHLTPNPAGSTTGTTCDTGSSIHRWNRTSTSTPPSAINARPITASTMSSASANTCTDASGDSMHGGRTALGNIAHNYYDHEGDIDNKNNCCDDDSSSPLRECAFCGRAVENLSRHLLRCKTRQRTQERRRRASAMASGGHTSMPGTAIQRVMSGGRSLPGHPKSDKRIDHARRLDYC